MDYNDKVFNSAREKGYMNGCENKKWNSTFVGAFLRKNPNRSGVLDIFKVILGHHPKWQDLTDDVFREFKEIVLDRMSDNSARTTFLRVRAVINEFDGEVCIPSKKWKDILKAKKESTISVYLSESDISLIEKFVPMTELEAYVKCATLISCYTGCRHSDAMKVTKENIHDGTFSYVPEKTSGIQVSMPVHKNLEKHIGKFEYKDIALSIYNTTMKNMCRLVGITDPVKVHRGGKDIVGEKWQFVGSHTSRRSFATNLYLRHCDIYTISKLMGHTNTEQTQKYICCKASIAKEALDFFGV